jgi:(p)ppGpp synthase/HD superfamily hydrolase
MNTLAIKAAQAFASVKHKDQVYGENEPYTTHLGHVAEVLRRFKFDSEDLQVAAWLHDVVEDTDATITQVEMMFGRNVADLVGRVTNEPGKNRKERHAKTYPKIQASLDATTLKLADRIANLEVSVENSSPQLQMYRKEHSAFKSLLYKPGVHEGMWRHIDFLIGDLNDQVVG